MYTWEILIKTTISCVEWSWLSNLFPNQISTLNSLENIKWSFELNFSLQMFVVSSKFLLKLPRKLIWRFNLVSRILISSNPMIAKLVFKFYLGFCFIRLPSQESFKKLAKVRPRFSSQMISKLPPSSTRPFYVDDSPNYPFTNLTVRLEGETKSLCNLQFLISWKGRKRAAR